MLVIFLWSLKLKPARSVLTKEKKKGGPPNGGWLATLFRIERALGVHTDDYTRHEGSVMVRHLLCVYYVF